MILYIFAMEDEAKDIIKDLELVKDRMFPLYRSNNNLYAITGIGKTNASFVTSYLAGKYPITKIVNLGFVGAVGNFKIGEQLLVEKARYHDVDVTMFGYEKGQVPKMPAYYEITQHQINEFPTIRRVNIYTGDYFMLEEIDTNYIADMEVTAIFQVAYRLNLPVYSFKVVSDIIGSNNHLADYSEFEAKGSLLIKELYNEISEVIK